MIVHQLAAESAPPRTIAVRVGNETEARVLQQAGFHEFMRSGSLNRTMEESEQGRRFGQFIFASVDRLRDGTEPPYLEGSDAEWLMDRVFSVRGTDSRTVALREKLVGLLVLSTVEIHRVPNDVATLYDQHPNEVSVASLISVR